MRLPRAVAASCAALAAAGGLAASSLAASGILTTVAGTGAPGFAGDGGPASSALLRLPADVAVTADGGYLIAEPGNRRVRKVSATGAIVTAAGTGPVGDTGEDGGEAVASPLDSPVGVAALADGGFLVADQAAHRVLRVSPAGRAAAVAGTGAAGSGGDGGRATSAELRGPAGLEALADGGFLIADMLNHRIRRVTATGTITTVAGTGTAGLSGDGGPARSAKLAWPTDVAVLRDGDMVIADMGNARIRRVDAATGRIFTVAGGGRPVESVTATAAPLGAPRSVAATGDGGFVFSDGGRHRVHRISPAGARSLLAGTGTAGSRGDGGAGTSAELSGPSGLAVTAAGGLLVADHGNHRIRHLDVDLRALPASDAPGAMPEAGTLPGAAAPGEGVPPAGDVAAGPAAGPATGPAASGPVAGAPAPPAPALGRRVVVAPASGTVLVRPPGAGGYVRLQAGMEVPVGSLLDTRRGAVDLTSALPGGATQTGRFSGGRFSVRQPRSGRGMTELVLRGPELGGCRASSRPARRTTARSARRKPARRLWGRDKGGRYRTRGRNSVTTVRGTRWLTQDTCAGTLTRVVEGAVDVRDVRRGVTRRVRAGGRLLVRPVGR